MTWLVVIFWAAVICVWITIACLAFLAGWCLYRIGRWCSPWIRRGYIALCGKYIAWRAERELATEQRMQAGMLTLKRYGCRVVSPHILESERVDCQCVVCREWHRRQGNPLPVAEDAQ